MRTLFALAVFTVLAAWTAVGEAKPRAASRSACRAACESVTAACVAAARPGTKRAARRCQRKALRRCMRVGLAACPPAFPPPPDPPRCSNAVPSLLGTWEGPVVDCTERCWEFGSPGGAFVERACDPPVLGDRRLEFVWQDCEHVATRDRWAGAVDVAHVPARFGLGLLDPAIPGAVRAGLSITGTLDGDALTDVRFFSGNPAIPPFCTRAVTVDAMLRVPAN